MQIIIEVTDDSVMDKILDFLNNFKKEISITIYDDELENKKDYKCSQD